MGIDILNIPRLGRKLAENKVHGWQSVVFLIAGNLLYILFSFVAAYILGFGSTPYIEVAVAESFIASVIVIFGVRACYNAYSGSNFMRDFIVLSVPALIYSTVLSWVIHWGFLYAVGKYGSTTSFSSAEAADASMASASKILEGGALIATTVGLLSFYYAIRLGLRATNDARVSSDHDN